MNGKSFLQCRARLGLGSLIQIMRVNRREPLKAEASDFVHLCTQDLVLLQGVETVLNGIKNDTNATLTAARSQDRTRSEPLRSMATCD